MSWSSEVYAFHTNTDAISMHCTAYSEAHLPHAVGVLNRQSGLPSARVATSLCCALMLLLALLLCLRAKAVLTIDPGVDRMDMTTVLANALKS